MSCLYILDINPLPVTSFANIFSQSVGCLFILFMVSFAMQKLFSLIKSHLFIFCFSFHYSWRWIKNYLAAIYVRVCSAVVFFKNFIVYGLTFRSVIHFEFIFVYSVREYSNFILLHVAVQFSKHNLFFTVYL